MKRTPKQEKELNQMILKYDLKKKAKKTKK
jgi:hypothetical protein